MCKCYSLPVLFWLMGTIGGGNLTDVDTGIPFCPVEAGITVTVCRLCRYVESDAGGTYYLLPLPLQMPRCLWRVLTLRFVSWRRIVIPWYIVVVITFFKWLLPSVPFYCILFCYLNSCCWRLPFVQRNGGSTVDDTFSVLMMMHSVFSIDWRCDVWGSRPTIDSDTGIYSGNYFLHVLDGDIGLILLLMRLYTTIERIARSFIHVLWYHCWKILVVVYTYHYLLLSLWYHILLREGWVDYSDDDTFCWREDDTDGEIHL